MKFEHDPVLLNEAVQSLNVISDGDYVDCTLGGGGHAAKILQRLKTGHLYAFDRDSNAIKYNRQHLKFGLKQGRLTLLHDNFKNLRAALNHFHVFGVDGILYDLGVSSPQFDDASRGFSYRQNSRLDMRMDQQQALSAWNVVNQWSGHRLVKILFKYGNENFAKSIVTQIERVRKRQPINTTFQLVRLIKAGIPAAARRHGGHPAKRTFQAIRIAVNDELNTLHSSLRQALTVIKVGGRVSVITFEPLEDRIVKDLFKRVSSLHDVPRGLPVIPKALQPRFRLVNRKPILPTRHEVLLNHRAHSAKLRTIEKIK